MATGPADRPAAVTPGRLWGVAMRHMTPLDWPGELGLSYPDAVGALGLKPTPVGYGLALCQDDRGARWTVVVPGDAPVAANHLLGSPELPADTPGRMATHPGWPVHQYLPDPPVGEPHDPAVNGALRPPTDRSAMRRAFADQIARHLASYGTLDAEDLDAWYRPGTNPGIANPEAITVLGLTSPVLDLDSARADEVLTGAEALSQSRDRVAGAIRVRPANDHAQLVTATTQTWSMIARIDGHPAPVLLHDDIPGDRPAFAHHTPMRLDPSHPRLSRLMATLAAA